MRNLKKILALVLALVMSLSLMATAGAAFSDAGEITESYQQAVEVLNGVNVFKGYENGSFVPKGNITRAEAAALIYRIATGDVNDTQKDIYTAWNGDGKLSDVSGWYAGYVNYCCNAGYIKGYPNGTFQAQNNVTGYEVLAMVLRAMGYGRNGEFSGSQWAITVGSLAQTLGITKNVKETLGEPATREMVAEIIFRAIFCETQRYNALHLYEGTGTNLAANLNLEKVSGVVTGNKWANLYDNKPMAEGKSRLALDDGSIYTVNADSTGEQIGLRVNAYVQNKTDVIGALETGENVVKSNQGAETTVKKLRDELKVDDTTEYYVNYNDAVEIGKSDWRIEYYIGLPGGAANWPNLVATNKGEWGYTINGTRYPNAYNKVIKVGDTITALDMEFMQDIFYGSDSKDEASDTDKFYGEVFVATRTGTNNKGESYDISDDLSWREFVNKYIDSTLEKFDGCDNGESLRIIDNDADGVADYVLRVDFVMTTIVDYNKKLERWTVEYDEKSNGTDYDVYTDIDNDDFVVDSELAVGDVILYALVDGVYYTEHPETFTGEIEKKGIDAKAGTIIVDGTTYTWSGINREARQFFSAIEFADVETNYVYYKDHFGYIRLYTTPNGDIVLLTDGYYNTDRRNPEFKASIYNESADEVQDFNLANNDDGFVIDTEGTEDYGNRGTWRRLDTFGRHYQGAKYSGGTLWMPAGGNNDVFLTNVALGAAAEDTELQDVTDLTHRRYDYNTYEIGSTVGSGSTKVTVDGRAVKDAQSKDATLWGISWTSGNKSDNPVTDSQEIRTTDMTKYYLVTYSVDTSATKLENRYVISDIETWIGRNGGEKANFKMDRAYAVTSQVSTASGTNYEVAEVVVIEQLTRVPTEAVMPIRRVGSDSQESLTRGGVDRTELDLAVGKTRSMLSNPTADLDLMLRFYDTGDNSRTKNGEITAEYASYGIYAGLMDSHHGTGWRSDDTIYRAKLKSQPDTFAPYGEVEFVRLVVNETREANGDSFRAYDVEDVESRINVNDDRVIYMTNADGDITMVLDIDQTVNTDGDDITAPQQLIDLYDEIVYDYMQYTKVRVQLDTENTPLAEYIRTIVAANASDVNLEYAPGDPVVIPLADIRNGNALTFYPVAEGLTAIDAAKFNLDKTTITAPGNAGIHIIVGQSTDDTIGASIHSNITQSTTDPWWHIDNNRLYIENVDFANGGWAEVWVTYETDYTDDEMKPYRVVEPDNQTNEDGDDIAWVEDVQDLGEYTNEQIMRMTFTPNTSGAWNPGHIVEVTVVVREDYTPNEPVVYDTEGNRVVFLAPNGNASATSALKYEGAYVPEEAPEVDDPAPEEELGYNEYTYRFIMPETKVTIGGNLAKAGATTPVLPTPVTPGVGVAPELEDKVDVTPATPEELESVAVPEAAKDDLAAKLGVEAEALEAKAQYTVTAEPDAFDADNRLQFSVKTNENEIPVAPNPLPEDVASMTIAPAPASRQKMASTVTDWIVTVTLKAAPEAPVDVEVVIVGVAEEEEPPVSTPTEVSSVAITWDTKTAVAVNGTLPVASTTTTGAKVTTVWKNASNETVTTAAAAGEYTGTVTVEAASADYTLASSLTYTGDVTSEAGLTAKITVSAGGSSTPTEVSSVAITWDTKTAVAVNGTLPVASTTTTGAKVTTVWKNASNETVTTAAAAGEYTGTVTVEAASADYTLASSLTYTGDVTSEAGLTAKITVSAGGSSTPTEVSSVAITWDTTTAVAVNGTLPVASTTTTGAKVTTVWKNASDEIVTTAAAAGEYTGTVTVEAASADYTLASSLTYTGDVTSEAGLTAKITVSE